MILHKSNNEKLKIIQPREKLKTIQLYNEKLKIIQPRGKVNPRVAVSITHCEEPIQPH